ncbi:hypothetical protein DMA11_19850 [Marinilabiliaceae bacterium JC017]|nr:hypothetical protein DMA11_19850 [Marinilabiliaceae bacterium JC017]
MKKIILLAFCVFIIVNASAQKKQYIHLKLIQPGVEYQFAIKSSLFASIDLGFGLINLSYNSADNFEAYISTFSNVTLKNVYNSLKVLNRNGNLLSHSGNYYGFRCLGYNKNVSNGSKVESFNYAIGPVWGVQRYYKSFYYQLELGLGYHSGSEINDIAPLARFCVGFNLKQW